MQNFLRIQGNISENQFYFKGSNSTTLVNSSIVVIDCLLGEYFNSESQLCELCGFGSYTLVENSMKCQQCPDDTICLGGMDISINQGYWRTNIYSDTIVKCDDVMYDVICLGGNTNQICKEGNIGALCQECDLFGEQWVDSYYGQFGNYEKCTTCKSQIKSIIIQTVFLSLFFMVSMSWTIKKNMYIVFVKLTQTHMLSLGFLSKGIDQPSFIIKIFNHYMQITGIITTFKLASFNQITIAFNFLSSPILFSESSFDCMLKDYDSSIIPHIYLKVIVQNLFFIGLVLSFFLIFLIIKVLKLTNYKFHHVLYTTLTYCFIILQPSILNQLFKLLSCRTVGGQQYMTYYMSHKCWNQEHIKFSFSFIFPLIFLLIFIIPGLFIRILYQNIKKEKLNSVDIRFSYGILYNEYTDEQSFWEIIKIFEKVIIISVTQIFGEQDVLKGVFVILILFAYALLNIKYQPYQTPMLNNLDLQQTVISSITILTALLIKQSSDITTTIIGLVFVFIVNAYLFLLIFRYLLMGYTQIFEVKIEQIKELIITKFPKARQYIKLKREMIINTKKNWAVLRKHFQNFASLKKQGKFVTAQVVTTQAYLENPQVFENLVKKNNQNNQMFIETFIVNESIKKYDRKAVVMTQNQLKGLQMFASILDRQKKKDFIKKKTMRSETVQEQQEDQKDGEEEEQENINTQDDQEEEEEEEEEEDEDEDDDEEEDNQKSEFKEDEQDQSKGSNTNQHEDLESEDQNNSSSHKTEKTEAFQKEEKSVDTTANEEQQKQEQKVDKALRMQKSQQFTSIYYLNQMINESYNISQNQQNDSSILPCLDNQVNIDDADVEHIDDRIPSIKRFEEINQNFKRSQLSEKNL